MDSGNLRESISLKLLLEMSTTQRLQMPRLSTWFHLCAVLTLACCLSLVSWIQSPPALALVQIRLFDISHAACPADVAEGAVTSGGTSMPADCFLITGKAENPTNKIVLNADIFGRIYDANNNSVMQNRTRLGSIEEVPPGISDFELRISVAANQATPLKLEQFKASGFTGKVRR